MVHKWIRSTVHSFIKSEPVDTVIVVKESIINHQSVKLSCFNICMKTVQSKQLLFQEIMLNNKMLKLLFKSIFYLIFRFENFYEDVFKEMSAYGEI